VRVLGLDPATQTDQLRRQLGSQLQDSGLPDRLRVDEALRLFAGPDAVDGVELLERFGLGHRRKLAFGTMSGGERQRLFLVLALLNRPRLVVLDELTQGLDPSARREVWAAVARLKADGTTVLLVTHELDDAEALCDRVVAMRDGRVLDAGTPAELVARHAPTATLRFTLPGLRDGDVAALRGLPAVTGVEVAGGLVTVSGRRAAIAHTGAWLVARGDVPGDLHSDVPDLTHALLTLLDAPTEPKAA
jgi:ABC-2 type transport system ATP-binding protein